VLGLCGLCELIGCVAPGFLRAHSAVRCSAVRYGAVRCGAPSGEGTVRVLYIAAHYTISIFSRKHLDVL